MNAFIDRFALWLADNYHLSTMLLVAVLVVAAFLRQPAKRLAVAKATIVAMLVIAGLMAFPGWSIVHLCLFERDGGPPAAKVSGLPECAGSGASCAGRGLKRRSGARAVGTRTASSLILDLDAFAPLAATCRGLLRDRRGDCACVVILGGTCREVARGPRAVGV